MPSIVAMVLLASSGWVLGTININGQLGSLRDTSGSVIASTPTLWVIIYDDNGDGQLPGGLGIDDSLTTSDAAAAWTAFAGKTLSEGTMINGDRVFAVSEFNHPSGVANFSFSELDLVTEGLVAGRIYGLYWFPGRALADNALPSTGAIDMGGISEITNYFGTGNNFLGMEIPPDQATVTTGVFDLNLVPGGLPPTRFDAITAQEAAGGDYSTWIAGFPAVGGEDGFGDDPDGDGLDNGLESALGTRPDTANPGITLLSAATGELSVQSSRAKPQLTDVTAVWEWSSDLVNWQGSGISNGSATVTISETITDPSDPDFDITEVEASGTGQLDRLFLRLNSSKTP